MPKGRNAELGDILDAVDNASDLQLCELKAINKKRASSGLRITRTNAGPATSGSDATQGNMRAFNRNRDKLKGNDKQQVQQTAEKISREAVKRAYSRDNRGRFTSANPPPAATRNARAPAQPKGGSVWAKGPSKSETTQQNKKADAQREAVEEQTKETIQRLDETNDLLKELVKETRKQKKQGIISGGGGGLDLDIGEGGMFKRMRKLGRKIFGKKGAKIAAGAADAAAAATLGEELADSASAKVSPTRGADSRFLSKAEKEAAKVGEKGAGKLALKGGLKAVGKVGLKAIPIIGTAIGAGIDACQGWNDTEGQKAAFGNRDIGTRQKAEYTVANVADMGGLVSGTSSLIGGGLDMLGFHDTAKAMQFTTADMARGVDNNGNDISDSRESFKAAFDGDSKEKNDDECNDKLITAVTAQGMQWGSGSGVPTSFPNDNPVQAAMRTERLSNTANSMAVDNNKMQYEGYIQNAAKANGVDPADLRAIIDVESSWNPTAVSGTGPVGLMQISKAVAKDMGYSETDRLEPKKSIEMGAVYYAKNLKTFGGNKRSALLGYNQGTGGARQMLSGKKQMATEGQNYMNNKNFSGILNNQPAALTADSPLLATPGDGGNAQSTKADKAVSAQVEKIQKMFQTVQDAYHGGDAKIAELMASHHIGTFGGTLSKGLDIPDAALPSGLRINAASIAKTHDYGKLTQEQIAAGGTKPVTQAQPGIMDILRGSTADTFNYATQGSSGNGILDGLMGGVNPMVADIMRPLTGKAGSMLDGWLNTGRSTVTDMISGRPSKQVGVIDLAASGTVPTVSRDSATAKSDTENNDTLTQILKALEKLVGVTEDGNKQNTTPGSANEAKHTAQPRPSGDIPLMSASKALLEMIEDVL